MNHLNTTIFVCFLFVNLHLHLGGLVNKMTKIYFLRFGRKISFLRFWQKYFAGFEKNVFLTKNAFLWFWRKNTFLQVWRGNAFCGFVSGKMILDLGFDFSVISRIS